jgi:uncharacterized protein YqjF (DUF2071 family)
MLSRFLLAGILFLAGVLHLVRPDLFNQAIPFEEKLAINIAAGVLEILLALGLLTRKWRDLAAKGSALWFLALIPIHVYISLKDIKVGEIDLTLLMWIRTFFQPVLFFWALSLQEKGWIISQRWSEVVFLHYKVDAKKLQEITPFPLDLYQGDAIVSIVPFVMGRIRFPFLFPIPGLAKLLELNLRTYVKVNGRPAVYFFTLDSNHLPGVLIARWFFSLPYRWVKLGFKHKDFYQFRSPQFEIKARVRGEKPSSELDLFLTERYALYTMRGSQNLVGIVEHEPWRLRELEIEEIKDNFSILIGDEFKMRDLLGASYAHSLDVRFRPFRRLK